MGGSGKTEHGELGLGVSCKSNDGKVAHLNFCPSSIYSFCVICHSGDICEHFDPHLDFMGIVQNAASTVHWHVEIEERQCPVLCLQKRVYVAKIEQSILHVAVRESHGMHTHFSTDIEVQNYQIKTTRELAVESDGIMRPNHLMLPDHQHSMGHTDPMMSLSAIHIWHNGERWLMSAETKGELCD
jgi:hypothetical protein